MRWITRTSIVPEEVTGAQDELPISDAEKKKFFQTTAERVFRL